MKEQRVELSRDWFMRERPASDAGCLKVETAYPTPFEDNKYYKVKEVAGLFDVDQDTVYEWIANGKIECQRLPGRRYRFFGKRLNEDLARLRARELGAAV